VWRTTASATYQQPFRETSIWATTIGWGRNEESGEATHALLAETNVTFADRHSWFGRFEITSKTAHDLDVPGRDMFTLAKLQGGYARYFTGWNGLRPGIGATVSAGIVPASLERVYGGRANAGIGVFLTLRPPASRVSQAAQPAASPVDHSQHGAPAPGEQ
jgi:hypothetical protein